MERPSAKSCIPLLSGPESKILLTGKEKDVNLVETTKKKNSFPLISISKSSISLYSRDEMKRIAGQIEVTNSSFNGHGSVNDPRMGVVSLNVTCSFCGQIDCPGHYGLIDFHPFMIYNPAYIKQIVSVLMCVCNSCGKLLIAREHMAQLGMLTLSYEKRLNAIKEYTKKINKCLNKKPPIGGGEVEECKGNPAFIIKDIKEKGEISYALKEDVQGKKSASSAILMSIETVQNILSMISEEDIQLLGFSPGNHPKNMIMSCILVPPIIARPPITEGSTIHHDQLSHMYNAIISRVVEASKNPGTKKIYDAVKQLMFKTESKKTGGREYLSIIERIQSKNAIMRALLMGKKNNYFGRTVAGPDPSLRFGFIRVPQVWVNDLTTKTKVTDFNREYLNDLLNKGHITHITSAKTGLRKFYDKKFNYRLQIGDQVDKYLEDGDRVVINRQPTLHKQSMMAYTVKLGDQDTIGAHLSYTTPKNADFDGDEFNLWKPQSYMVEAECKILMNVVNNIMSGEQNKPIMGLVMNSVTGAYLLSRPTTRIDDDLFRELLNMITPQKINGRDPLLTLHSRLVKHGVHPRSGQAIFSALLPEDFNYRLGKVIILDGILVSGLLTKSHVGTSHRSIVQDLHKRYRAQRTADFLTDAPWVICKWLMERGFSVGMLDLINEEIDPQTGKIVDKNEQVAKREINKILIELEALGGKIDNPEEEAIRQRRISELVGSAQRVGMVIAEEMLLKGENSLGVMSDKGSGAKGDSVNIGQMVGTVAQQYFRGEILKPTISGKRRLLPTYDYDDPRPESRGFIPSSFFKGISPEALFFLQSAGREGILDTSLKTAETGAMHHRMVKAFENIIIGYDGSIRNTVGTMFAPMYNSGYDVAEMLSVSNKGRSTTSFTDIKSIVRNLNANRGWFPADEVNIIKANRAKISSTPAIKEGILFTDPTPPPPLPVRLPPHEIDRTPLYSKVTKYEKSRIIGTRATQLSNNARPIVDIGQEIDPINIAMKEYETGNLPYYIVRKFGNGEYRTISPTLENI